MKSHRVKWRHVRKQATASGNSNRTKALQGNKKLNETSLIFHCFIQRELPKLVAFLNKPKQFQQLLQANTVTLAKWKQEGPAFVVAMVY